MATPRPEPYSVMTYLSQMYHHFAKTIPTLPEKPQPKVEEKEEDVVEVVEGKAEEEVTEDKTEK